MNQTNMGNYIARKRREKNLTQEQLAEQLGVSNKTISKWKMHSRLQRNRIPLSDIVHYAF